MQRQSAALAHIVLESHAVLAGYQASSETEARLAFRFHTLASTFTDVFGSCGIVLTQVSPGSQVS